MQPRTPLSFFATKAHCCLMFNLDVHQDPIGLFWQAALHPNGPGLGLYLPRGSTSASLAELDEVPITPFFSLLRSLWMAAQPPCVKTPPSFVVWAKLLKVHSHPITEVMNEDVKQDWTHYWPLGYMARYWLPACVIFMLYSRLRGIISEIILYISSITSINNFISYRRRSIAIFKKSWFN